MSSCELCGRSMRGKGRQVRIEGALMLLCPTCAARFGRVSTHSTAPPAQVPHSPSWTESPRTATHHSTRPVHVARRVPRRPVSRKHQTTLDDMILVEDYADIIRRARQKAGMSQEELAQRIGERISTLQAIESGRLKPTGKTIRGLERELGISLLEPIDPVPIRASHGTRTSAVTLGDRVIVKRRKPQKKRQSSN